MLRVIPKLPLCCYSPLRVSSYRNDVGGIHIQNTYHYHKIRNIATHQSLKQEHTHTPKLTLFNPPFHNTIYLHTQKRHSSNFSKSPENNSDNSDKKGQENKNSSNNNNNNSSNNNNNSNNSDNQSGFSKTYARQRSKLIYWLTRWKPFNLDHIVALLQWLLVGTGALIVVGTTTLFSILLFLTNAFHSQEWVASKLGEYLTRNTGLNITFERAEGDWKNRSIQLHNLVVSRNPTPSQPLSTINLTIARVDVKLSFPLYIEGKGLIKELHVFGVRGFVDRRTEGYANKNDSENNNNNNNNINNSKVSNDSDESQNKPNNTDTDSNDIHTLPSALGTIAAILSPTTAESYSNDNTDTSFVLNTSRSGRKWNRGDFVFENFSLRDALITYHLPDPTHRPLSISIYTLECDLLRRHWLLLDLLSSKSIVGKIDGCLFTYTIPQGIKMSRISRYRPTLAGFPGFETLGEYGEFERDTDHTHSHPHAHPHSHTHVHDTFKQQSLSDYRGFNVGEDGAFVNNKRELKIDGVNMNILSRNASGPLGWIREGTLDIHMLIQLPPKLVDDTPFYSHEERPQYILTPNGDVVSKSGGLNPYTSLSYDQRSHVNPRDFLVLMNFSVQFNHLHASAPFYSPRLSYVNNALIHPILAYINTHSKHIPLRFTVALPQGVFEGAWTPYEAYFWEALSFAVEGAFTQLVQEKKNPETIKYVWNELLGEFWGWLRSWVSSNEPLFIVH